MPVPWTARRLAVAAAVSLAVGSLAACGSGFTAETSLEHTVADGVNGTVGSIDVRNGYLVGPTVDTRTSGFVSLYNRGLDGDRLLGASSPLAGSIQLEQEAADGFLTPVQSIELPPDAAAVLTPGSYRLLLSGLNQQLLGGTHHLVTLRFEKAGDLTLDWPVQPADGTGASIGPLRDQVRATPAAPATQSPTASEAAPPEATASSPSGTAPGGQPAGTTEPPPPSP